MKTDDMTFVGDTGETVDFSDDSKRGQLRVKIYAFSDTGSTRLRLNADEVVDLRDWLNQLINVYEVEK